MPLDEELVQKSYEMLRAVGWQGVAMVEFKVDRRDGRPKLMEVNGRFWGSLQLPVDAGMNFPLLLYRAAAGEKIIPQFDYKIAVKHRWFLGDLDHLLIRLTHPIGPNGSSGGEESRLRACLNFLKFFEPSLHYEVLRFDDPWPGIVELGSYAGQTLRSLRRRSV